MAAPPRTLELLHGIRRRRNLVSLARRCQRALLVTGALFLVAVLATLPLGLLPDWTGYQLLVIWPLVALLAAGIGWRGCSLHEAARLADGAGDQEDLFVTALVLDQSPGAYQPIVARDAEQRAAELRPSAIQPWRPWRGLGLLVLVGVVLGGALALPQADPFGLREEERRLQQQRERLAETERITEQRAEALAERQLDAELSEEVARRLEQLSQDFQRMERKQQQRNHSVLSKHQQGLGELYRQRQREQLRQAAEQLQQAQQLGSQNEAARRVRDELAKGDASGIKRELQQLQELAERKRAAAERGDRDEAQKLGQELRERLEQLTQAAERQQGADGDLARSLKQALEQLQLADQPGLQSEALQALKESLQLAELDAEQLAQALRDLEGLEQALQNLQMAKALNQQGQLDGEGAGQGQSMADYAKLYEELMRGQGQGQGQGQGGMGGPGQGRGGVAPEDDAVATDFQTEKTRSALQAGRMLMQWKSQGMGERGEVAAEYRGSLQRVESGLSEASLHEQIPPGYHEGIKAYFDDLVEREEAAATDE